MKRRETCLSVCVFCLLPSAFILSLSTLSPVGSKLPALYHEGMEQGRTSATVRRAKLLIGDDSPVERMALAYLLRTSGYDVDEAADGSATLHHLKHRPVDLLLLDLNMPEGDGFDVLAYLQKHRPGLPVILLSGMPVDQIQHKMHRLPSHELPPLFIKPIDPNQLLEVLELKLSGQLPDGTE
jgi:CheY-like chemotaxis protein